MKKVSILCLVAASLFLLGSCAPVYQLRSGTYHMTLKTGPESATPQMKTVLMTVEDNRITIKNAESTEILNGELKGDQFMVSSRDGEQSVEFMGTLGADNQVSGDAVHKKKGKVLFNGGFTLTPAQ